MKLIRRDVLTVYPSEPCEPHVMYMSGADHIVRPRHLPLLVFYKAREDGEEVMPTQLLKNSLSSLLSKFYPAAGRLRRRSSDRKLELLCNNAGVEFVEATVDGTLNEFDGFTPNKFYTELLDPVPVGFGEAFTEFPITYIQVTRFACGGVSLVTTINHACTDGLSVNQFLTSWSEVARGLEMSNPPFHDRTLLKVQTSPNPDFNPKELRSLVSVQQVTPNGDLTSWPAERMFLFTPEQLKRVKKLAVGAGEHGTFTTFEAINAHVWRSVTKARNLPANTPSKFLTTLDMRKRLKPNLPEGYFGNAICFVSASSTSHDIVQNALSYSANVIREAIHGFSESYYRNFLAFAQSHPHPLVMNVNWAESAGHDVSVSSWARMGFMNLDFGSGNPVFCGPGNNPFEGSIFMLPTDKGDGFLNIFVSLKPQHMKNLESDAEFFLRD
ncbi:hypothetical protein M758_5G083900 [Ceratodon purpureus]|nr:hypothetical protein M758_5G083900 [Ceratodon purpureus]